MFECKQFYSSCLVSLASLEEQHGKFVKWCSNPNRSGKRIENKIICNGLPWVQDYLDSTWKRSLTHLNGMDQQENKFAVAAIGDKDSVVGHLMKGKGGRFAKTIFYFLRASEYHGCRVHVTGQAINQGDDKGMKIPCTLMFKGQSKFVDILSQELKKHM